MVPQKALIVRPIGPEQAALRLSGLEALDPRGMCDAGELRAMCDEGQCFEVQGDARAVYVVLVRNGVCWVQAVAGCGDVDITAVVDAVIVEQAKGLRAIGLQTQRRGLVRKLERHGYRVTGWVMRKELLQ